MNTTEAMAVRVTEVRRSILANQSKRGGWTKAYLASMGVPWPPPKGWRRKLERDGVFAT